MDIISKEELMNAAVEYIRSKNWREKELSDIYGAYCNVVDGMVALTEMPQISNSQINQLAIIYLNSRNEEFKRQKVAEGNPSSYHKEIANILINMSKENTDAKPSQQE